MISHREYKLLSKFKAGPVDQVGLDAEEQAMFQKKWIKATNFNGLDGLTACEWALDTAGEAALEEYERMLDQQSKEEAHRRKERKFQVFIAILTVALTSGFALLLEYGGSLVKFLSSNPPLTWG